MKREHFKQLLTEYQISVRQFVSQRFAVFKPTGFNDRKVVLDEARKNSLLRMKKQYSFKNLEAMPVFKLHVAVFKGNADAQIKRWGFTKGPDFSPIQCSLEIEGKTYEV